MAKQQFSIWKTTRIFVTDVLDEYRDLTAGYSYDIIPSCPPVLTSLGHAANLSG